MEVDAHPNRLKAVGMLFVCLGFAILFPGGLLYLLHMEFAKLIHALETQRPLFVQSRGMGAMFAMPLFSLLFLILSGFGLYRIVTGIDHPIPERGKQRLMTILGSLSVVMLGVMISGVFINNAYWGSQFRDAGYHRCPSGFQITSRWATAVWVQEPQFCHLRMVRRMMINAEYSKDDLDAYLREWDG